MPHAVSSPSEERLWLERARAGDKAAFSHIIRSYQGPVYNLCYRMLSDPSEAEDATQEAFLRAYIHLDRYDPDRRFLTWLLSIASNHCIDRLRRRRFTWLGLEEMLESPSTPKLTMQTDTPQQAAERHEEAEEVQHWVSQLTPAYRTPLILRYWHELSYAEIAETMNLSVPAVKSRLHRARQQIAEIILAQKARPAPASATPTPAPG